MTAASEWGRLFVEILIFANLWCHEWTRGIPAVSRQMGGPGFPVLSVNYNCVETCSRYLIARAVTGCWWLTYCSDCKYQNNPRDESHQQAPQINGGFHRPPVLSDAEKEINVSGGRPKRRFFVPLRIAFEPLTQHHARRVQRSYWDYAGLRSSRLRVRAAFLSGLP
jgi:hypothetical protein